MARPYPSEVSRVGLLASRGHLKGLWPTSYRRRRGSSDPDSHSRECGWIGSPSSSPRRPRRSGTSRSCSAGHSARRPSAATSDATWPRSSPCAARPASTVEALTPDRARAILAVDFRRSARGRLFPCPRGPPVVGDSRARAVRRRSPGGTVTIRYQIRVPDERRVDRDEDGGLGGYPCPCPVPWTTRLRDHLARQDAERPIVPFGDLLVFVTEKGFAVARLG